MSKPMRAEEVLATVAARLQIGRNCQATNRLSQIT